MPLQRKKSHANIFEGLDCQFDVQITHLLLIIELDIYMSWILRTHVLIFPRVYDITVSSTSIHRALAEEYSSGHKINYL